MQLGNALFQFSYIPSMCDYNFVNTNDTFGFFVVGLKCFTFCKIDYGSSWRSGQRDFLDNGKWEKSGFFFVLESQYFLFVFTVVHSSYIRIDEIKINKCKNRIRK